MSIAAPPQFDAAHARNWCDADAARAYRFRAPYPPDVFSLLLSLVADQPRAVLDVGCGTGNIARGLAPFVERVDAIDLAQEMIDEGRALAGGDHPHIVWRQGRGEDAPLSPPYALVVGGQSLHWMDWETVLPRFAAAMTPHAALAVAIVVETEPPPWSDGLAVLVKKYSTHTDYVPFDMIGAWERAGLFRKAGEATLATIPFTQPLDDFIAGFHATSALTRAHIDAAAFDAEVAALMAPYCVGARVTRAIAGNVVWGRPLGG